MLLANHGRLCLHPFSFIAINFNPSLLKQFFQDNFMKILIPAYILSVLRKPGDYYLARVVTSL